MGVLLTTLTGRSLNSSTLPGCPLSSTLYSRLPIFMVPAGTATLVLPSAVTMSEGESPVAYSAVGLRLTITARLRPPNGAGEESPSIVKSWTRMKLRL